MGRKKEEERMKLVDCTPHMHIVRKDGTVLNLDAAGIVPRCSTRVEHGENGEIIVTNIVFGEVTGLPESKVDKYFVVSRLVLQACR